MTKAFWKGLAQYGLGLALLAWVVSKYWNPTPGPGLADALQRPLQPLPLLLAFAITAGATLITFARWYVLVRALDLPCAPAAALRFSLIGYFYNTFLPGSVGGDAVKAYCLARAQDRRAAAVATVLFDRLIGLWALAAVVALFGGAFWLQGDPVLMANDSLLTILRGAWIVVLISVAAWLVLGAFSDDWADRRALAIGRWPKVGPTLAEISRAIWVYRRHRLAVTVVVLLSLVGHVGFVLAFFFAAHIFHDPADPTGLPTLAEHFLIVPVGMLIKAIPLAPGGVGVGELGYGNLYRLVGRPAAAGIFGSLAVLVVTWTLGFVGYLVHLFAPEPRAAVEQA